MDHVVKSDQQMRRRTVVKGAAWAAPVVTMGVAAPSLAASPPPVNPTLTSRGFCKHPGNQPTSPSRYHLGITWNNGLPCETTITITSITLTPFSGQPVSFEGLSPVTVPRYDSVGRTYDSVETTNSSNGTVTVSYKYTTCEGKTVAASVPLSADSLPPCSQYGIPDYGKPGHP